MSFVTVSAKAALKAYFEKKYGLAITSRGEQAAHLKALGYKFRIGDIVCERDGKHLARIDAILPTLVASVTYLDTKWKGHLDLADIVKIK